MAKPRQIKGNRTDVDISYSTSTFRCVGTRNDNVMITFLPLLSGA